MIEVVFYEDKSGRICGFTSKGHAGYKESGSDIICSAVSMLSINTVNAIETFTDDVFECDMEEKDGYLSFKITSKVSPESELLLKTMRLGIEGVISEYGEEYVAVSTVENA